MPKVRTRVALAVISAVTIALELMLMRALALRFWHHFAYLIIATALLGFGASGTLLTLFRSAIRRRLQGTLCAASLLLGLAVLGAVRGADLVPLSVQRINWDLAQIANLVGVEMIFLVPMLLAGIGVGASLMDAPERVSGHYAANLIGSGAGAAAAVVMMELLPLPQGITALAAAALLAGLVVAPWRRPAAVAAAVVTAAVGAAICWGLPWRPPLSQYKALAIARRVPGTETVARAEGPLGRVDVLAGPAIHHVPAGLSLSCPEPLPDAALMTVDGDQASAVWRAPVPSPATAPAPGAPAPAPTTGPPPLVTGTTAPTATGEPFAFLDWTTAALPYRLLDKPAVLVLGAGGGEAIALALRHGSPRVVAVEMNPDVIELMRGPLRERGGAVYDAPDVRVVCAEARGYLAGTSERFDLIQLAVPDTSAASGAGVLAGQESHLLTVEGFARMLSLLRPNGMLSVTCPLRKPPRDELRLLDTAYLALETHLERLGLPPERRSPRNHLVLIRNYDAVTLLVVNGTPGEKEAYAVKDFCADRSFDVVFYSSLKLLELERFHEADPTYSTLYLGAEAVCGPDRDAFVGDYVFNVRATTDDRPYFFNFFRFRALPVIFEQLGNVGRGYVEVGYVLLLAAVAQAVPVAALLILLPLAGRARVLRAATGKFRAFAYFLLIGLGFMLLEMMFLQKLTLYLAHPIYSAAVVIGVFLVFAGIGSRMSQSWKLPPQTVIRRAGVAVVALSVLYVLGMKYLLSVTGGWPLGGRAALVVVLLAPLAAAMGHMFPAAVRIIGVDSPALVPWCWGINGFASVVATVGATLMAMEVGFISVAIAGAGAYLLASSVWPPAPPEPEPTGRDGKPRRRSGLEL